MANEDNLNLRFDIEGSGSRELDNITRKLRDLGTSAEYASRKQVNGAKSARDAYKSEADVLEALAATEAKMARLQASTKTSANRVTASNATTAATVANAGPKAAATTQLAQNRAATEQARAANLAQEQGNRNNLAQQRVITEQVKATNAQREQENRNLIAAGKLLTEQERQQAAITSRLIAQDRERDRQTDRAARLQAQTNAATLKAEEQRSRLVNNRIGRERTAAIAAERNAAALASPGLGGERRAALTAERSVSTRDIEQTNALRYALYDTAQTATLVGTALVGVGAASVVAAAQGEQQFANLSATIGDTTYDLEALDQSLIDLTTQNPIDLSETIGVAKLGAQMNIANSDLTDFTSTVTQFSAVTGIAGDTAGEAIGRISQLLKVPPEEFKNLSSSIYQVGVDSVATESQILKTSQEIAGSASAYGFTADAVVGLSGAFASLAIQPEQARGATTRIFNAIQTAVQSGGPALDKYARIMDTTRDSAEELWKSDPSAFFERLVHGLSQSENRLEDLRSIGAKGVYDTNVLNRLADNADFLSKSLDTAKSAYDDGTATSNAYAKASDTLIARLKELRNSVVALGIRAGAPIVAALSPVVDIIKFIVDGFADMPPVVLSVLASIALLGGGLLLAGGALATAIAAVIGLRYVLTQLGAAGVGTGLSLATLRTQVGLLWAEMGLASAASVRLTGTVAAAGAGARVAATGMSTMGLVMRGIQWAAGIGLGLQFSYMLIENALHAQQAADGLRKVQDATGKVSTETLISSFRTANATVKEFKDQFNGRTGFTDQLNAQVNSFFNQFFDAAPKLNNAKRELSAIDNQLTSMVSNGGAGKAAATVKELGLSASEVATLLPNYSEALKEAGTSSLKFGDDTLTASSQLEAYKASLESAQDGVNQLFGTLNQGSDFASSIQQLFSGIYDAGNAFGYLNETGRTNLANLQDAIGQTIAYGQSLGLSSSNSVALLFYQLQQSGVDTAGLLNLIASQPYVFSADLDISKVQDKLKMLGMNGGSASGVAKNATAFNGLNGAMGKLATSAPRAASGIKKTKKAAQEAAKEVRTLNDYASDLNTVFTDARQYRFGVQDALDDIEGKWGDIQGEIEDNNKKLADHKQEIADARDELSKYRAELGQLQAQLSQQKYFLNIAVQYGDSLRGQEITADITDLQAQIADKQKDVNQSQRDSTAPFENTTKSILDQRQSLGDLYESYEKAIVEYARSGATQAQLAQRVEELRQDFVRQATQAGYSKQEIDRYSGAFRDMTVAINGVPRKITVSANVDPAIRALNDFLAKANNSRATPSVDPDNGTTYQNGIDAGITLGDGVNTGLKRRLDSATVTMQLESVFGKGQAVARSTVGGITFADGGFIPGKNAFPVGGYVPGAPPADRRQDNTLGMTPGGAVLLQGGEPIMTNAARSKYGDAMFDQINALRFQPSVIRPQVTVQAGSGAGYTELSPYDRAQMQRLIESVGLTISATAVQRAAGAGNVASSRRRAG